MRVATTVVLALACSRLVSAQIVTTSENLARESVTCTAKDCESPVTVLSRHMTRGEVVKLQNYGWELLWTLAKSGPPKLRDALGDVEKNYYRLVWECRDENGGTTSLKSFVVHKGAQTAIHTLPGITQELQPAQLLDVFIASDANTILYTQYVSTPVKNPLAAQIPAFIEKEKMMDLLAALPLARGAATAGSIETTYTVAKPILPLARADLKIQDTLITPGSKTSLRTASTALGRKLTTYDLRLSSCGQKLAAADAAAIAETLDGAACSVAADQTPAAAAAAVATCKASLLDAIAAEFSKAATCRDNPPAPGGDPLVTVDNAFREKVNSLQESRQKPVESSLSNTPRTRYSFGALTAAILGSPPGGNERAKVGSNGSIIHDPLPTLLTMAVVNVHPLPYDADADRPMWAERVRLFVGPSLTPDFGVGGGVGVMILRGLTANVGWADLFIKTAHDGFSIGQTPPPNSPPLGVGNAGVWFTGLSFSFK